MIKIKFASIVFLLLGFMAFSDSARAQDATTTRVKFAKGATSAVYTGRISRTEGVQHYELRARAGQRISISVSAPSNNVKFMFYPSGSARQINGNGKSWSWALEDDGDYIITVQSTRGAANFRLNISVR